MNIKDLMKSYYSWLEDETSFEVIGDYVEINTPFIDSANDSIQIYAKKDGDGIILSDDGYTLNNLASHGVSLSRTRKSLIEGILRQYGTKLSGDELTVRATEGDFPVRKHMFIQSMLRIDDLFALSRENVANTFADDVREFLDSRGIYYTRDIQLAGRSGYTYLYDYVFQRSRNKPERLCQVLNTPSKNIVGSTLFSWEDTKGARDADSQLIVILNDRNKGLASEARMAFQGYSASVILWSERDTAENISMLSA